MNINVEDCYGFVVESEKKAIIVMEVADSTAARKILERHGYRLIGSSELYSLFNHSQRFFNAISLYLCFVKAL